MLAARTRPTRSKKTILSVAAIILAVEALSGFGGIECGVCEEQSVQECCCADPIICQARPELLGYLQSRSRIGTLALTLGVHVQVLTSTVTSNGLPSAHSPGTGARFWRIAKRQRSIIGCHTTAAIGGPACKTDVRQFTVEGPVT